GTEVSRFDPIGESRWTSHARRALFRPDESSLARTRVPSHNRRRSQRRSRAPLRTLRVASSRAETPTAPVSNCTGERRRAPAGEAPGRGWPATALHTHLRLRTHRTPRQGPTALKTTRTPR